MYFLKSLIGAAIALSAVVALVGVSANAAPEDKKPKGKPDHVILAQALHHLRSIEHSLEKANHNYGGHKEKAIKEVNAAERQLRLALEHVHKNYKPKSGEKNPKDNPRQEPQRLSDKQLAEAVKDLHHTVKHLKDADDNYGGHKKKAIENVEQAANQLEKALKFSKDDKKDKN